MWNNQLRGARARARRCGVVGEREKSVGERAAAPRGDALNTGTEKEKVRDEAPQLALLHDRVPIVVHVQRRHDLERHEQRGDDARTEVEARHGRQLGEPLDEEIEHVLVAHGALGLGREDAIV